MPRDTGTHGTETRVPPHSAPPARSVPPFAPIRAGRGRRRLRRKRRIAGAGLAMVAAALAFSGPGGGQAQPTAVGAEAAPGRATVSAPVRIADADAVRLLRPGDRVDVLAGGRVVATRAPVVTIPEAPDAASAREGALVVLLVPRGTAATLAGADAPLAVALS